MTPQLILMIVLVIATVAYWRVVLSLFLGGTVILLAIGLARLFELLHMTSV
jgi:hypothetical protein